MSDILETKARLRAGLDQHVALESVSASVKCADLALILASHDALEEALTPSAGTKYALLGEFRQAVGSRKVTIEWTTIKEIMQAIRDHADALLKEADQ